MPCFDSDSTQRRMEDAKMLGRSEERRVGKEWRSRGWPGPLKKKKSIRIGERL